MSESIDKILSHYSEAMSQWVSPITQTISEIQSKMIKDQEDELLIEASQAVGYTIDREELIKAMNYDREQFAQGYEKGHERGYTTGYAKAISDFAEKMKQTINEQVGNDGGFSKAFYTGMVEGIRILLESEITDKPKREIGCYSCPNVGHIDKPDCKDAYTENARYCKLYNHSTWEEKK